MSDRLDYLLGNPNNARTQYRKKLEALSIVLTDEIAELAEFEAPCFVSSQSFDRRSPPR